MPMNQVRLAKLTQPRSDGLLRRERLFGRLDEARSRPAVWIAAPPGAGKTSLLASYLDARKLTALWYQVDSGDADPATFFYYLAIAAGGRLGRKAKPLPLFSQEVATDVVSFARRFFRELCAVLPQDAVLVLDNYQEVPERSQFHAVMQAVLDEIPAGICVICMSRAEAPAEFARLRVAQRMSMLDFEALRLTPDEARQIAAGHSQLDEAALQAVYEQTNGWAAGLVLMAERLRQTGQVNKPTSSTNLEMVFDYFAGQILNALPESTQDMLIRMSYLPRLVAETAQAITGDPEAVRLLEHLAKRNLFTDRRYGEDISFQFHALFRAFLQEQARDRLGASEHKKTAHSAAALLQATGQVEDAFPLFAETGAWGSAAALIGKEAERLVQQGRRQTLRQWITALPMERVEETPSLQYWLGICTLGSHQEKARELLTAAFEGFKREDDLEGQLTAAATATNSFFTMRSGWSGLGAWIDRLLEMQSQDLSEVQPTARIRSTIALGRAMFYHQPERPHLNQVVDTLRGYVNDGDLNPNERVAAGAIVLAHQLIHGNSDGCEETLEVLRGLEDLPEVSAASRSFLYFWWISLECWRGRAGDALALVERAKREHDELGLSPVTVEFERLGTAARIVQGNFAEARRIIESKVAPSLGTARIGATAYYHIYMGVCALGEEDLPAARRHLDAGIGILQAHGSVLAELLNYHLLGLLLAAEGRYDEAHRLLLEHGERLRRWGNRKLEALSTACRAHVFLRQGNEADALAALRESFALFAEHTDVLGRLSVALFGDLFSFALTHAIGTDWLPDFIRRRGFRCRSLDIEAWPWPIRARTLGGLDLQRDSAAASRSTKAQHRLLDLLKALVAYGREGVNGVDLADALWPDSEGDSAQSALQVSLYRLRKLLGRDDAIQVQDGKVTVNRQLCWVDAWAFEDKAARLNGLARNDPQFEPLARSALALYRGHLFAKEKDQPWMLAPRERLRRQWLSVVKVLGEHYEGSGEWVRASDLYQQALDIDPIAEEIYRRLMICQQERGERTEAISTYERCTRQLQIALGVGPSAETQKVYRALSA